MAVYKVAQDVEADDKLLGPFTFRQFIYLIIVAISGALAYGLSKIFMPLFIIPMPLVLFFGALALPLRKDQPMEVYLAALLSFYLKPRKRLWRPDGIESLVEITAPNTPEIQRIKDISRNEAENRLSYLAEIVDTEGWAVRRTTVPQANNAMNTDAFYEAQQTTDVYDSSSGVAQSFNTMISQSAERQRQQAVDKMYAAIKEPVSQPAPTPSPQPVPVVAPTVAPQPAVPTVSTPTPAANDSADGKDLPDIQFNPYPTSIRQSVIQPLDLDDQVANDSAPADIPHETQTTTSLSTSDKPLSPDIINLANNSDLSIETLSREANRAKAKGGDGEVFISLH